MRLKSLADYSATGASKTQPEVNVSEEGSGGSADSSIPNVSLEFRSGVRRAAVNCDSSESSARLLETVIRALADVTPISEDQGEAPPAAEEG
jgi:hypothetical protein